MTKITILLPTYNRREYISIALRCIQSQIFEDWKLIIINDGGESIKDIVDSFNEPRFEYHERPHLGKAASLNYALKSVDSKYIAYMDDDDEVYSNHLQLLHDAAEEMDKEFVFSDTKLTVFDGNGNITFEGIENSSDVTFEDIRYVNKINHKQILHTTALQKKVGLYDESLRILIDYDYIRRLAKLAEPYHVKEITGNHYLRQKISDGAAITDLWIKDPATAGKSVLNVFRKTPEDMASLYKKFAEFQSNIKLLERTRILCNNLAASQEEYGKTIKKQEEIIAQQTKLIEKLEKALQAK